MNVSKVTTALCMTTVHVCVRWCRGCAWPVSGCDATLAESTLYTISLMAERVGVGGWHCDHISKISQTAIFPPHSGLTRLPHRHRHMTGILSTQQEVALQTVCFGVFLFQTGVE